MKLFLLAILASRLGSFRYLVGFTGHQGLHIRTQKTQDGQIHFYSSRFSFSLSCKEDADKVWPAEIGEWVLLKRGAHHVHTGGGDEAVHHVFHVRDLKPIPKVIKANLFLWVEILSVKDIQWHLSLHLRNH